MREVWGSWGLGGRVYTRLDLLVIIVWKEEWSHIFIALVLGVERDILHYIPYPHALRDT